TGRAALNGSSAFLTQILRVPLYGFGNDRVFPSGEICAPPIVISPKKRLRSMMGGWSARTMQGEPRIASATAVAARFFMTASQAGERQIGAHCASEGLG